jgi:hypothetical protein
VHGVNGEDIRLVGLVDSSPESRGQREKEKRKTGDGVKKDRRRERVFVDGGVRL